mmetsp:Transcript_25684/g.48273  ORF Transcript_25684/g.48273 Transcript_25684/m.48273 type:complete len:428 (+) Transcript_25684:119-1402(+)
MKSPQPPPSPTPPPASPTIAEYFTTLFDANIAIRDELSASPRLRSTSVGDAAGFSAFFEDFIEDVKKIFEDNPLERQEHYHDLSCDDDDDDEMTLESPPLSPAAIPPISPPPPTADVGSKPRSRLSPTSIFACCRRSPGPPPDREFDLLHPSTPSSKPNSNRPRINTIDSTPTRKNTRRPSLRNSFSHRLSFVDADNATDEELVGHVGPMFPMCSDNELRRFCKMAGGSKAKMEEGLREHLKWREMEASEEKLRAAEEGLGDGASKTFIRKLDGLSNDGFQVLYIQGGKFDPNIPVENYTLKVAKLLFDLFNFEDVGRAAVLVDCRAGKGWPNPRADKMIPLIKNVNSLLANHFPDRTHQIILYPIPGFMKPIWNTISLLLDKKARSQFYVLAGANSLTAKVPKELQNFVSISIIPEDMRQFHAGLP